MGAKIEPGILASSLASQPGFWVGHFFVPSEIDTSDLHDHIFTYFDQAELKPVYQQPGRTWPEVLGANGQQEVPAFWQIARYVEINDLARRLLEIQLRLEDEFPIHFLSLSDQVVVYKIRGSTMGTFARRPEILEGVMQVHLRFGPSSVGGNGFAAWMADTVDVIIEGGAQDGTAKGASGGYVAVMKDLNDDGLRIDGSMGKSFAYGAQKGILIVQGNADSRACIRLSGADVVIGSEITRKIKEASFRLPTHANIEGLAYEYMTSGQMLIMGDPGPYAFSGMTGGVVYQKLTPEFGFDEHSLASRIALGAQVKIQALKVGDIANIQELLGYYINALEQTYQYENAEQIRTLTMGNALLRYSVKVIPHHPESSKALLQPALETVRR